MPEIGAISKLPNHYQQHSIIAFAICVSIRYGIIDYLEQRYLFFEDNEQKVDILQKNIVVNIIFYIVGTDSVKVGMLVAPCAI
jgi:hypothetical protein